MTEKTMPYESRVNPYFPHQVLMESTSVWDAGKIIRPSLDIRRFQHGET
jgi:hypothetical protein